MKNLREAEEQIKYLESKGWEWCEVNGHDYAWINFSDGGYPISREGGTLWERDLKGWKYREVLMQLNKGRSFRRI